MAAEDDPPRPDAVPEPPPAEMVNDRYRVVDYLGRGGMGDVCLVHDNLAGGTSLALKRLRRDKIDPRSAATLRREFLSLSWLRHPNLVRVFDFGVDRRTGDLFFTSELVRGVSWLEHSKGYAPEWEKKLESILGPLSQALRALEFVHCHGLIHCDIKPDNLLVTVPGASPGGGGEGCEGGGAMKIIDFGLVKREGAPREEKILGTPYYVAPETILGSRVDRRSDLYSLGVVLYHIATGRPPFLGDTNLAILKSHVERAPVPPQSLIPGLPRELGELILRLMEKNPAARFQGALEVLEHVNRAFGFSIPLETPETQRSYPHAAELAGRERERSTLYAAFLKASCAEPTLFQELPNVLPGADQIDLTVSTQSLVSPPGRLVLLAGEKGLGKRRLLGDLLRMAQAAGADILTVECAGGGETPSGGLDSLLGALTRHAWADWPNGIPAHVQSAFLLADSAGETPSADMEDGFHAASEEAALALLASACDQPRLLVVHDIHQAGRVVLGLMGSIVALSAKGQVPNSKLIVAAAGLDPAECRGGAFQDLAEAPSFRDQILEIRIGRFDEERVGHLVSASFPSAHFPERFGGRLLEESDGNLDALLLILNHFLDRKKIARRGRGWELEGDYEGEDFPGKARGKVQDRLSRFPRGALQLAKAFACLGDGADLPLAVELAGLHPRDVMPSMAVLTEEKILEAKGQGRREDHFAFIHVNARSILYQSIPPGQLAAMHDHAGTILEAKGASPREVARHYLRARNKEKGIQYGVPAARELAERQSWVEAIEMYESLLELLEASEEKLRIAIRRELASLRFQVGDYKGVLDLLGGWSSRGVSNESRMASIDVARAHAKLGHYRQAASLLDATLGVEGHEPSVPVRLSALLARAEVRFWQGRLVESYRICREILKETSGSQASWSQTAWSQAGGSQASSSQAGGPQDSAFRWQLHMLAAENLAQLHQLPAASRECQEALRVVDAQHDPRFLALSLFCRGKYYQYRAQPSRALKQFRLCRMLGSGSHPAEGKADCLLELGRTYHLLGADRDARSVLEEALGHYEKTGNLSRYVATQALLCEVYRLTGDVEGCRWALKELLESSAHQKRSRIFLEALLGFAGHALDIGDVVAADRYLQEARAQVSEEAGTSGGMLRILLLSAERRFQIGDLAGALDDVGRGIVRSRELGDVILMARFLALDAYLLCRLGRTGRARRSILMLSDVAKRHELAASGGWALLGEAMVLVREGKLRPAGDLFGKARQLFLDRGGDRDLVHLQLEHGLACLEAGEHEQAYLNLEEGLHAARSLGLVYMQSQFLFALGRLESAISGGTEHRLLERLLEAEGIAREKGYGELLWRIQLEIGRMSGRLGNDGAAAAWTQRATASLSSVLCHVPEEDRDGYFAGLGGGEPQLAEEAATTS